MHSILSSYSISVNCHYTGNICALFSIFGKFQDTFLNLEFFISLLLPIAISWALLPALRKLHCCPKGLREAHSAGNRLLYLGCSEAFGLVTIQALIYSAFVLGKSSLNSVKLMKLIEMHLFKNSVL